MAPDQARKIAIWPTIIATLQIGWRYPKQHIILSLLVTLPLAIFIAFSISVKKHWELLLVWDLIWLYPVYIVWQRLFLMGPELYLKLSAKQLAKIWLRVVAFVLGLFIVESAIAAVFLAGVYGLLWIGNHMLGADGPHLAKLIIIIALPFVILLMAFIFVRLIPAYVSLFVEETISLQHSWQLMQGNTGRCLAVIFSMVLGGAPLIFATTWLYWHASLAIYSLEFTSPATDIKIVGAVYLILSPLQYILTAAITAAQAIIYRDLVPQSEHLVDVTV